MSPLRQRPPDDVAPQKVSETRISFRDILPAVAGYILLYGALNYVVNQFVLDDSFFMTEWENVFGPSEMGQMLEQRGRWMLIGYAFIPISVAAKILFPAMCLAVGFAIADWNCSFRRLVCAAVRAELMLAIGAVTHLICILFVTDIDSMLEYATFYPLSALNVVSLDAQNGWMSYALRTVNVFEVGYILVLGIEIHKSMQKGLRQCLLMAALSYGTGLTLLILTVTFAMLYVS